MAFSTAARLSESDTLGLAEFSDTPALMREAARLRDDGHGNIVTYSRKVFIPLTHLCRDACHYCTFSHPPRDNEQLFMTEEQVLTVVRRGEATGCTEVLFTLGDKPELRYSAAQIALNTLGHASTLDYLQSAADLVLKNSTLLPHLNPGVMTADDFVKLRPVAASMGLMLETVSERLSSRGGPHFGSPDKIPAVRTRVHPCRRRSCDPLHQRASHRNWRNPSRADRKSPRASQSARRVRPCAGDHHSAIQG